MELEVSTPGSDNWSDFSEEAIDSYMNDTGGSNAGAHPTPIRLRPKSFAVELTITDFANRIIGHDLLVSDGGRDDLRFIFGKLRKGTVRIAIVDFERTYTYTRA